MSIVVQFTAAPASFVFADANGPVRVELERLVTFGREVPSFAWVPAGDTEAFEAAVADDSHVAHATLVEAGSKSFYRVDWADPRPDLLESIEATDGLVRRCRLAGDRWQFRVRFQDADGVQSFQRRQAAAGLDLDVTKVRSLDDESEETPSGLTTKQYLALRAAYQLGYFERPREVTTQDLAERFDVSTQSVSALLRRGMENLLEDEIPLESVEEPPASIDQDASRQPGE